MTENLKIRKNGRYYQIGYYHKSKWINIMHLGTAEYVYKLIRDLKHLHTTMINVPFPTDENYVVKP